MASSPGGSYTLHGLCLKGSALPDDLPPALGAGDLHLALARGDAADGLAALADEIFVLLVLTALPGGGEAVLDGLPPVQEFGVLRPPLGQVPGEGPEQHQERQRQGYCLQDQPRRLVPAQQDLDQPDQEVRRQQGGVQLVRAVAAVHEPGDGPGDPIKEIPHEDEASVSALFLLV